MKADDNIPIETIDLGLKLLSSQSNIDEIFGRSASDELQLENLDNFDCVEHPEA